MHVEFMIEFPDSVLKLNKSWNLGTRREWTIHSYELTEAKTSTQLWFEFCNFGETQIIWEKFRQERWKQQKGLKVRKGADKWLLITLRRKEHGELRSLLEMQQRLLYKIWSPWFTIPQRRKTEEAGLGGSLANLDEIGNKSFTLRGEGTKTGSRYRPWSTVFPKNLL